MGNISLSSTRDDFNYLCHLSVELWQKMQHIFNFPKINSAWQGLVCSKCIEKVSIKSMNGKNWFWFAHLTKLNVWCWSSVISSAPKKLVSTRRISIRSYNHNGSLPSQHWGTAKTNGVHDLWNHTDSPTIGLNELRLCLFSLLKNILWGKCKELLNCV